MSDGAKAEQSDLTNARLAEMYRPHLESWRDLWQSNHGISRPMFLKTSPAYFAARPRVLFVGQETHGWWTDCPIPSQVLTSHEVMDFYVGTKRWLHDKYRPSPYWDAIRRITAALNIDDPCESYLISNIFPCDVDRKRAPDAMLETMRKWCLLPQEIEILQPDFVVFFIGPVYTYNLGRYFNRELAQPLSVLNRLQSYMPMQGNWQGWVTYHPKSLQLSRATDVVLEQLVSLIRVDHPR